MFIDGRHLPASQAPEGRHVYRKWDKQIPKAPVALNPDLSGRGDM